MQFFSSAGNFNWHTVGLRDGVFVMCSISIVCLAWEKGWTFPHCSDSGGDVPPGGGEAGLCQGEKLPGQPRQCNKTGSSNYRESVTIFLSPFFIIPTHLGSLCFRIFAKSFDFAEIFEPAKTSAVSCQAQRYNVVSNLQAPQCHWHRLVKLSDTMLYLIFRLRSVIDIAESSSAVSCLYTV